MIAMRNPYPPERPDLASMLMLIPGRSLGIAAFDLGEQAPFRGLFDEPEESGDSEQ